MTAREAQCATDLPQGELESLMWSQAISEASVAFQCSVIWNYISHNIFTFFPNKHQSLCYSRRRTGPNWDLKFVVLILQMQIYIVVFLLLSSGAVSAGLEKVLRQAEFIADIYQQFPHCCIFIMNSEAQQQGED